MRLVVTGRNVEITPALRQLIERKLAKLERMLNDSIVSVQVVLGLEKYRYLSEITVHARGDHMLHGVGDAGGWQASLKAAVEKIAQQAKRLKGKWAERKRRAVAAKALPAAEAPPVRPATRRRGPSPVVRASRYPVKPMSVEDAALRVESGPDAFLVFRNATTDSVNILYRRKDGRLGLIEPEA